MNYIEQEESYTSKASFLDLDVLPVFDAEKPYTGTFSGKRIKRGLYSSKSGKLITADVNGAANILRKSKQRLDLERLCGVLGQSFENKGSLGCQTSHESPASLGGSSSNIKFFGEEL